MAKTMLRVALDGVAFYLNEVSAGAGGKRRYRLSRTSDFGKTKDGIVRINSTEHQALEGAPGDAELFAACVLLFDGKPKLTYTRPPIIRGCAGRWEGEAFGMRKSAKESLLG